MMTKTAEYLLTHPVATKLAQFFAPVVGALCALFILYNIETRFMPVVDEFTITRFERQGGEFILSGVLHKHRPCELLAVNVLGEPVTAGQPSRVLYQLEPEAMLGGNAPTGRVTWGPVVLRIPVGFDRQVFGLSRIRIMATHRCHALWSQEGEYTTFPVSYLPPPKE